MFGRLSTSTPRSFSAGQLSSHSPPSLQCCMELLWLKCRHLALLNLTVRLGPSIQPVQIPLQSLPTLEQVDTPAQVGVICKLPEGALDPLIQITDKDVQQNCPWYWALGSPTGDRPPAGCNFIHCQSLHSAIQPVLYPVKKFKQQRISNRNLPFVDKWLTDDGFNSLYFPLFTFFNLPQLHLEYVLNLLHFSLVKLHPCIKELS